MEYIEDDLPLPSFDSIFGDIAAFSTSDSLKKKKKRKKAAAVEYTGRWTNEEHKLFLDGILLYGRDWKKIQPLIKTRSLIQIRTHAQKIFKNLPSKKLTKGSFKDLKDDIDEVSSSDEEEISTSDGNIRDHASYPNDMLRSNDHQGSPSMSNITSSYAYPMNHSYGYSYPSTLTVSNDASLVPRGIDHSNNNNNNGVHSTQMNPGTHDVVQRNIHNMSIPLDMSSLANSEEYEDGSEDDDYCDIFAS